MSLPSIKDIDWKLDDAKLRKQLLLYSYKDLVKIGKLKDLHYSLRGKKGDIVNTIIAHKTKTAPKKKKSKKKLVKLSDEDRRAYLGLSEDVPLPVEGAHTKKQVRWTDDEYKERVKFAKPGKLFTQKFDADSTYNFIVMKSDPNTLRYLQETNENGRVYKDFVGHTTLLTDDEYDDYLQAIGEHPLFGHTGVHDASKKGKVHWAGAIMTNDKGKIYELNAGSGHFWTNEEECEAFKKYWFPDPQGKKIECVEVDDALQAFLNIFKGYGYTGAHQQNQNSYNILEDSQYQVQQGYNDYGMNNDYGTYSNYGTYGKEMKLYQPNLGVNDSELVMFGVGSVLVGAIVLFICCLCLVGGVVIGVFLTRRYYGKKKWNIVECNEISSV